MEPFVLTLEEDGKLKAMHGLLWARKGLLEVELWLRCRHGLARRESQRR